MFIHKNLSRSLRFAVMTLVAVAFSVSAWAQNISVTGTVTDVNGEPIIGAYVVQQGTQNGTATDVDGKYQISVPSNGTLVFTLVGMKDAVVPVNGKAVINVTMQEDSEMLDDVIVVGFGTQKKENLTGAVASVDVSKTLEARPVADVSRGLQGAVPGLTIQVGSGEVGSDAIMKIRGQMASIQGSSNPLILLDNVEIPNINLVNPEDIESISILKDAASASIYGAKAAFGVILITSKKGSATDKVDVSFSANWAFQSLSKNFQMADVDGLAYTVDAAERIGVTTPTGAFWLIDRAGLNAAYAWKNKYGKSLSPNDPMVYGRDWYVNEEGSKIGVRTYDSYEYLLRDVAPTQTYNFSVNGKSNKTTYAISAAYLDQSGMLKTAKHDDFRRWNVNARVSSQVNDWLTLRTGLMYSRNQKRYNYATNSTTADVWYYLFRWGSSYPLVAQDEWGNNLRNATYETAAANTATRTNNYTSANVGATITPLKDWNIDFDYTYANSENITNEPGYKFTAGDTWGAPLPTGNSVSNEWNEFNNLGGSIAQYQLNCYQYTATGSGMDHIYRSTSNSTRSTLIAKTSYQYVLNEKHTFNVLAGLQAVKYDYATNWSKRMELIDITNPQFTLANGTQTVGGSESWESQLGVFGRLNYNYNDKYLLEANIRYDGSSKFPTDLQWRWFPSFSAGWRVSEEPWMQWSKNVLSSMKIRASWGMIGDQTVSNSLYVPTMSSSQHNWLIDGNKLMTYGTPAAVSDAITWQDIQSTDIGVEARFLDGDLGFTFDWFQRDTKNMIVPMEGLTYTYGTSAPQGNFGELRTRGFEISVDYGHIFDNGLSLRLSASLADAKTTIMKYGSTTSISSWYEGKTYGEIWGYRSDRLYQDADFVKDANGNLVTIKSKDGYTVYETVNGVTQGKLQSSSNFMFGPGDVMFKDLNGDGVINNGTQTVEDHGDLDIIGNSTPRYEYNFRIGAAWKGFDLDLFFQGVGSRQIWGEGSMAQAGFGSSDGAMPQAIAGDYWTPERTNAFYPRPFNNGNSNNLNNMQISDRYLLNMAYLRLKNVTFGYTLPEKLTRKAHISKLRVYVALENFLTFDHLGDLPIDPEEVSGYSMWNTSNYNSGRTGVGVPTFKTASFGVQLNF